MHNFKVKELIQDCQEILKSKGIKNARLESKLIVQKAIRKTNLDLVLNPEMKISYGEKKKILKKVFCRTEGKPISKIFGTREFYSNKFIVNSYVLDPRPESEILVEKIIDICEKKKEKKISILELGVGSGCLIISILKELDRNQVHGLGVDFSSKALLVAEKNRKRFKMNQAFKIKKSNWFSSIRNKFDIIFSNPPYIKSNEIKYLDKEVKLFDPLIALDGGFSGFRSYLKIASEAKHYLKKNGLILLELGQGQLNRVSKIFNRFGYQTILEEKDLQGINRVVGYKLKNIES